MSTKYQFNGLILEFGCNHMGNMDIAKSMIDEFSTIPSVDILKFQKRHISPETLLNYNERHPKPSNSFGDTYGKHRQALEFTTEQHAELKAEVESKNKIYMSSVWDQKSLQDIASLNPQHIKIPSPKNRDQKLINAMIDSSIENLHISLGMLSHLQATELINNFLKFKKSYQKVTFYHCVSGYPVPTEQTCLLEIQKLDKMFSNEKQGISIGYSAHHAGIDLDTAALILGAKSIERHATLDQNWKGTDQKLSLLPSQVIDLSSKLAIVSKYMNERPVDSILPIEETSAAKFYPEGFNIH